MAVKPLDDRILVKQCEAEVKTAGGIVLPDSAQEIMILALNGMKNQEIADELNISINTVKTQKKIAYSKLKQKLEPRFETVLLSLMW